MGSLYYICLSRHLQIVLFKNTIDSIIPSSLGIFCLGLVLILWWFTGYKEKKRYGKVIYHTAYINRLKKYNDFSFTKLVKYNRKHPLQIMKDLNSLFHEGTIQTCEQKVVEYFNTLYKDYPYFTFSYSNLTSKFHLKLKVNYHELLC